MRQMSMFNRVFVVFIRLTGLSAEGSLQGIKITMDHW